MAKHHGVRQQKRLLKQKAKRQTRRKQLARQTAKNPTIRLQAANGWPIVAALVPENLWTGGLGQLVFARRTPDGQRACAVFLVDVFCLGIKNAFWKILPDAEYRDLVERIGQFGELKDVLPEHFAKIVYGAADYAASLGFAPHVDFRHARRLLDGVDPSQCPDPLEFGRDGKPLYIRGPHETLEKARWIAHRLTAVDGHYIVHLEPAAAESLLLEEAEILDEFEDDERDQVAAR
jgi:hypothetical protein